MFTEIIGVMLLLISSQVAFVTFAMFLVGLGWSAVWVASSAYIADHTEPGERGSVTGATDAAAAGASITLPLLAGVMLELGGVTALVTSAVNVSLPAVYFCLKILKKGWFKA